MEVKAFTDVAPSQTSWSDPIVPGFSASTYIVFETEVRQPESVYRKWNVVSLDVFVGV